MKSTRVRHSVCILLGGSLLWSCAFTERVMPLTMSHGNVVAVLNTIDETEAEAGELGKQKGASPNVRSFASRLAHEHRTSIVDRQHLAEQINVQPQKPSLASALEDMQEESNRLLEQKSGRDFDEAYIQEQIRIHQQLVGLIQDTEDSMDDPALRQHLRYIRPDLLSHLSAAQAAQRQLMAQR
jgi:putative membrane protein